MIDLTEDTLAPDVVVRHATATDIDVRQGEQGGPPVVGVAEGAVWARAEASSPGVDLGHGTLNVVVRSGTVLLDAQAGAGLVIVLRGEVEISASGTLDRIATAGDALTFDATGRVSDPDPVDAAELARDPFVSLNLVLDALGGVPVRIPGEPSAAVPTAADMPPMPAEPARPEAEEMFPERRRSKGLFARSKR
jgi:ferric-dicitrate binding protein FerR (iron transport regulator)